MDYLQNEWKAGDTVAPAKLAGHEKIGEREQWDSDTFEGAFPDGQYILGHVTARNLVDTHHSKQAIAHR